MQLTRRRRAVHRQRDQRGASAVEYARIVALLAAVTAVSLTLLSNVMEGEYVHTCKQVATYDGDTC